MIICLLYKANNEVERLLEFENVSERGVELLKLHDVYELSLDSRNGDSVLFLGKDKRTFLPLLLQLVSRVQCLLLVCRLSLELPLCWHSSELQ